MDHAWSASAGALSQVLGAGRLNVMRVVGSVEELFLGGGEARCFLDRRFLLWGAPTGLGGHAVWGCPEAVDAERFVAALEVILAQGERHPRTLVADFRRLELVDPAAFQHLREHVNRHGPSFDRLVTREAVLRPEGVLGSVVAGFYHVTTASPRTRVFARPDEALAWLGHLEALFLLEQLDALRARRQSAAGLLDRLRVLLTGDQRLASLAAVARRLHVSTRSLQRHLKASGTTFREELHHARLRRARELLRADVKLAAVAAELGFTQPQHFATWFKEHTGTTPSQWRGRSRNSRR